MSLKHLANLLFGIGLFASASIAQGYDVVTDYGGGNNTNTNANSKTYAILVGSRAPSLNGVTDAIRGDLDVDHVYSQLESWVSDIKVLNYNYNSFSNSVAYDIQKAASSIGAQVKPGDTFIFYYSGHGTGGTGDNVQDYINPVNQGLGYQDNSLAALFSDNTSFKDVNKFFLIDSCHSEGMWNNDTDADLDLQTLTDISFLASSSENGVAYSSSDSDPKLNGTSFFTNAILPSLTPGTSFGSLLASAQAASGTVTGYVKGNGLSTGAWSPVGYTSDDFSENTVLGHIVVPEPGTFILMLTGIAAILVWRRRR